MMDVIFWIALAVSIIALGLLYTRKIDTRILDNLALCSAFLNLPPLVRAIKWGHEFFMFLFPICYFTAVYFLLKGVQASLGEKENYNRAIIIIWAVSTLTLMITHLPVIWMILGVIMSGGQMVILSK
ncbi:MAG: hypothetical protein KIT34_00325 [Cyanobacteria bacterium TGS_CYA1]|nr:hypothetical protein [Cyanobacteria bacterium TGS_CYA1]